MTTEWLQFGLAIIVFCGGCLAVALRIGYIVANTVNKITLETDAKIGKMWIRFDEYKEHLEKEFVRKETCSLSHVNIATALEMATREYHRAHEELKTQVAKISDKVDVLLMRKE
jgi:uncharacterized membrane-anchored protein YhcB (DUF1043 family)